MRKTIGNLTVDLKNGVSLINGEKLDLTPKEFKILAILWESVDQVVTREAILKYVWDKTHVSDRVIDNHVTALRKKSKRHPFESKVFTLKVINFFQISSVEKPLKQDASTPRRRSRTC